MDFTVNETSVTTTEIRLKGRLSYTDNDSFLKLLEHFKGRPPEHRFVIDLSGLEFIDSNGLGMFLVARDAAMKANYELILRGPQTPVKRVMDMVDFGTLFQISPHVYALWLAGRAQPL